jgi:hypothetical protein
LLSNFPFAIKTLPDGSKRYFVGEHDVSADIRTPEITAQVSAVTTHLTHSRTCADD